jgi:uncharacterized membrane protein YdjX (TVP38/TMEM64 family)
MIKFSQKHILLLILFFGLIIVAWYLRQYGYFSPEQILELKLKHPIIAPVIYIACHVIAMLLMIPTLPFNLGAGVLWGPFWGGVVSTFGGGIGALIAFIIARSAIGQPLAKKFDNRIIVWMQKEFDEKGWRIVAFSRINPVLPSSILNYVFGITSIRFSTYAWATIVFLFIPSLAISIIGHEIGSFALAGKIADISRTVIIIAAAVTFLLIIRLLMKSVVKIREEN